MTAGTANLLSKPDLNHFKVVGYSPLLIFKAIFHE